MRKQNSRFINSRKKRNFYKVLLIFTVFLYSTYLIGNVFAASDYPSTSSVKVLTCYNNNQDHTHTDSCYSDGIDVSQVIQLVYGESPGYVDTPGTVVNMFDYWTTNNRTDNDFTWDHSVDWSRGINNGHELKFRLDNGSTSSNIYTGSSERRTGMVKNRLGLDGYPVLSDKVLQDAADSLNNADIASGGSLQYLFDPSYSHDGKASFSNVKGLFQTNSEGYHCYNSQVNYAYLDESNKNNYMFNLYDCWGVWPNTTANASGTKGQFFPFTDYETAANETANSGNLNHYFGMAMTTRFIQQFGGYTNGAQTNETHFKFSGDDDVWIFIDGVLVGDLGGIRNEVSIDINFATGEIEINEIRGSGHTEVNNKSYTTLYDLYSATLGEENISSIFTTVKDVNGDIVKDDDGNDTYTFADNTTHTLKFFYLERGNYDSNLLLEFNMNDVPETSIYKVDQYGEALEGAGFAAYSATGSTTSNSSTGSHAHYSYITDSGATVAASDIDNLINTNPGAISSSGVITLENDKITPKLTVETDTSGKATFVDDDGVRYGPDELEKLLGPVFILRETKIPTGYRSASDTICMYYTNQILQCAEPYSSGVWASPNALITAPYILSIASDSTSTALKMDSEAIDKNQMTINYSTIGATDSEGTLFAVVLKRNGADKNATSLSDLNFSTWDPVSGNDINGYTVASWGEGTDYATQMDAVIAIAKNEQHVFTNNAGAMQLTFEDLPGDITRYYSYVYETGSTVDTTEPQYLVAYYWTSGSLQNASADNTVRIASHENTISSTVSGTAAFNVMWGSTIEVPNFENRLYVQKRDTDTNPVEGASFALYAVGEEEDGTIYYTGYATSDTEKLSPVSIYLSDADEANTGTASLSKGDTTPPYTYRIDINGTITLYDSDGKKAYTITGILAEDAPNSGNYDGKLSKGVQYFGKLTEGYYMVREVSVPSGYLLNPTETKVIVTADGVFANAGTKDDGVDVGNGVGYLTKTLDVFASEGSIDETLTWIVSALRVNTKDAQQTFSGFSLGNTAVYAKYADDDKAGYGDDTTTYISEALVTYLVFDRSSGSTLYDYRPSIVQDPRKVGDKVTYTPLNGTESKTVTLAQANPFTGQGETTLGLYTDEGWSALEIYQDYSLGSQLTSDDTYYTNLNGNNIANLFSNSTFVLYTDEMKADLEIVKTGEALTGETETKYLKGVQFTLQDIDSKEYYYSATDENGVTVTGFETYEGSFEDETLASKYLQTTRNDGKVHFLNLPEGDYLLKEVKVPDSTYMVIADQIIHVGPKTLSDKTITYVTMSDYTPVKLSGEEASSTFSYRVEIEDPLNRSTPISLLKTDQGSTGLPGAEFVLYTKSGTENRYYQASIVDGSTTISWIADEAKATKMTSNTAGMITFSDLRPGTYYLKETTAPDGFTLDTEEKVFKLTYTVNGSSDSDSGDGSGTDSGEENGTFSIEVLSGSNISVSSSNQLELVMKNIKVYELPSAGGFGTLYFYLLGCLLMGLAFCLYAHYLQTEK